VIEIPGESGHEIRFVDFTEEGPDTLALDLAR
jgi:hypothetical protein